MKSVKNINNKSFGGLLILVLGLSSCKSLNVSVREATKSLPTVYQGSAMDTTNSGHLSWRTYFKDAYLAQLIDTALKNNQELNIIMQEIQIARNEIRAKKGEYLPFVSGMMGAGADKPGRFTRNGAVEANMDIESGKEFPEPLQDYILGFQSEWEVDVWGKLRNAKKAAVKRYLSSLEGKNFMVTNLVSEIAKEYYELIALDQILNKINQNLELQNNAIRIVRQQKEAAKTSELAVQRFLAQYYNTQSLKFEIEQKIVLCENRINFLIGRLPQRVERGANEFDTLVPLQVQQGIPSQLLRNRVDIKQAELELEANKIDVKVARANFYPSMRISTSVGLQAFKPTYLITKSPESMLFGLAGDLVAPLINRNAIKAEYYSATAAQLKAVFNYEQTVLKAYIEVINQMASIDNLEKSYDLKLNEVKALNRSVEISNTLFKSARIDYLEILLTQEERINSQLDLIEIKKKQLHAAVNAYKALGGGWN